MQFDSRPKVSVHVTQTNETYLCATGESLLQGMLRLGRKGIPVGYTLACRMAPISAVRLEVAGKMQKPFSRGRAESATASPLSQQQ